MWLWEEWVYILDLFKWVFECVFVKEVFEKEVCLVYWEKVKDSVVVIFKFIEFLFFKNILLYVYVFENKVLVFEVEFMFVIEFMSFVRGKKMVCEI